ncbi:type I restriction enzyme M protein [Thermotomaculum hydrothermale]|uniref:site-specific DNA-methyltransferase (adenine-specific) n=1 Tax=Thermotomaculum hydrothermale TaxID=981385 RepID=A0A7R6PNR5_9BACT|nr:N-6 DNA methylase [Thermotomaculum hydrothermale]BBB33008.1 type I restriction enzyme M protein [Thermotomaculum hydrothermale]
MLDAETKRRIDTARDILVGKVPDPKSQVEQITIALIYKFMDDMDRESIEMGGKRSFFTGDYEKYSWRNIFNPRLGGFEMLNLYAEAITKMSHNPNLPELFRNIFKNAYLPYRDPETLKLFLKTINEFEYDHSERLGDAFEYLLSVLGSQGDAGQFRTPRHIIDFIVKIINPKKNELILDPACGTAGFLISAYKHILCENTSEKYKSHNGICMGDLLTTDERKKLYKNFKGYDISPDMVRLSLVNMYLHGFVNPQIYEYDTLTSEDRWNEYADVILANPPFMSPKGGIKPHRRFSVQSKRSEVLFVNYIAEHLTPTGRAGVIVPEGIIFQSAKAYKQLRKMLVENYLYAVVSLPAGVFQPYSGVKTSILLMDKVLVKKADSILFIKIENDGFDLGAQRRPIDKNDLPDALNVIREYIEKVISGKVDEFNPDENPCSALLVKKEKLAENGDYNLTGDRYRVIEKRINQKWPMVKLGDVLIYEQPANYIVKSENYSNEFKTPVLTAGKTFILGYTNEEDGIFPKEKLPVIIFDDFTTARKFVDFPFKVKSSAMKILLATERINIKYAFYIMQKINIDTTQHKRYWISEFSNLYIPLPPLEVQKEIVSEIEGYQKIIDGCKQVIDNWKPDVEGYLDEELKEYLAQHPEKKEELSDGWPMVKLGEVCEINPESANPYDLYGDCEVIYIDINSVENGTGKVSFDNRILTKNAPSRARRIVKENDVLLSTVRPNLKAFTILKNLPQKIVASTGFAVLRSKNYIIPEYLFSCIYSEFIINQMIKKMGKGAYPSINSNDVKNLIIPLPPLKVQQRIVGKIEAERKVIDGCRKLIKTYEEKIKKVIDKVWGE